MAFVRPGICKSVEEARRLLTNSHVMFMSFFISREESADRLSTDLKTFSRSVIIDENARIVTAFLMQVDPGKTWAAHSLVGARDTSVADPRSSGRHGVPNPVGA